MPPEVEIVIDILSAKDLRSLLTVEQLARRWQCTSAFTYRRLRASGIRLVRVYGYGQQYRVRRSDVKALEKALTIYLAQRPKGKEHTNSTALPCASD